MSATPLVGWDMTGPERVVNIDRDHIMQCYIESLLPTT
jgi:hypothetical protein